MKIAIDFGGTAVKISGYKGEDFNPLWFETIPAHSEQGIRQAMERAEQVIDAHRTGQLECLGIATPGIVDSKACRVTCINNKYEDALDIDFRAWCKERFGCGLIMSNDANAALVGEVAYGCAQGFENCVLVIIGTGVGTAAMMDGKLVRGKHNQAGILGGHFIVNPFGRGCTCGAVGCLEAYAGSREILYQAEAERDHVTSAIYRERPLTMKGIARCWENGDRYAARILETAIGYYAAAAVNMIRAYDPECVVLSGGLTNSRFIVQEIEQIVRRQGWLPWGVPVFRHAERTDLSVSMGLLKEMCDYERD